MTRINIVSVEELSNQWLIAEYRELPRIILSKNIQLKDAPKQYKLGKGHVKWAITHADYCINRYSQLCKEMKYRGFKVNYPYENLYEKYINSDKHKQSQQYIPTYNDIMLNKERLIEKYHLKPNFYCWTKRNKPEWLYIC